MLPEQELEQLRTRMKQEHLIEKEKRALKRRELWKDVGNLFGVLFAGLAVTLLSAFFAMLGLGVLHSYWPHIPAMGYWETYLVLAVINIVGAGVKSGWKTKKKD